MQLYTRQAGELEQGVDERGHAECTIVNLFDIAPALLVEPVAAGIPDYLDLAVDGGQWRIEVMGDGIVEGFKLLVC